VHVLEVSHIHALHHSMRLRLRSGDITSKKKRPIAAWSLTKPHSDRSSFSQRTSSADAFTTTTRSQISPPLLNNTNTQLHDFTESPVLTCFQQSCSTKTFPRANLYCSHRSPVGPTSSNPPLHHLHIPRAISEATEATEATQHHS
jgi:hypothetical protein